MFKIRSFRFKLVVSYIIIIFVSFGFIGFYLDNDIRTRLYRDISASLVNQAYLIEYQIRPSDLKKENIPVFDSTIKKLSGIINCRITVIDINGVVMADSGMPPEDLASMENHASRPEMQAALSGVVGQARRHSDTIGADMVYSAVPISSEAAVLGAVRLAIPVHAVNQMVLAARRILFLSLILALFLSFVIGYILTRGITEPINKIIRASGKFSRGDFSHTIYLDSDDEIGRLAATLNTMARSLEEKIGEIEIKNQHLLAVFESMVEGIIVVDKDNRIVSVNSAFERIFDAARKDLEGKVFLEAVRNSDISDIIGSVLSSGAVKSSELSVVWPVQRIFQINASPVFERGEVTGCLLVIHDVTELRKLETMRRDFVANVSHELKTPLTAMKGFVETLLEGALEDKDNARAFLKIIGDHTERLNSLVNDLLDLSYLESKNVRFDPERFDLSELAVRVLSGFGSHLKKKKVGVQFDLPDKLAVNADKDKIEQVLTNLIDNSIKFNRENGSIRVFAEVRDRSVKIKIKDSGAGIPEKDLPRIFERFYRVDKARSRELGGTGLGLAIVKHIVELHGGSVGVESIEGLGSTFWFSLPK